MDPQGGLRLVPRPSSVRCTFAEGEATAVKSMRQNSSVASFLGHSLSPHASEWLSCPIRFPRPRTWRSRDAARSLRERSEAWSLSL